MPPVPSSPPHPIAVPFRGARVLASREEASVAVLRMPNGIEAVSRLRRETGAPLVDRLREQQARAELTALAELPLPGVPRPIALLRTREAVGTLVEFVPGVQIDALDRAYLPDVLAQLGALLGSIHRLGWTHGDVKPANVVYDPESSSVGLIDWEHATRIGQEARPGTLGYALPSAWENGFRSEPQNDIYSLARTALAAYGVPVDDGKTGAAPRIVKKALAALPREVRSWLIVAMDDRRLPSRSAASCPSTSRTRDVVVREGVAPTVGRFSTRRGRDDDLLVVVELPVRTEATAVARAVAASLFLDGRENTFAACWLGLSSKQLVDGGDASCQRDSIVRRTREASSFLRELVDTAVVLASGSEDAVEEGRTRITAAVLRRESRVRCVEVLARVRTTAPGTADAWLKRAAELLGASSRVNPDTSRLHANNLRELIEIIATEDLTREATGGTPSARLGIDGALLRLEELAAVGAMAEGEPLLRECVTRYRAARSMEPEVWFRLGLSASELCDRRLAQRCYMVAVDLGHKEAQTELATLLYAAGEFRASVASAVRAALRDEPSVRLRSLLNLALARSGDFPAAWRVGRSLMRAARRGEPMVLVEVVRHLATLARYRRRMHTAQRLVRYALGAVRQHAAVRAEMQLLAASDLAWCSSRAGRRAAERWETNRDACLDLGLNDEAARNSIRAAREWLGAGNWTAAQFSLDVVSAAAKQLGAYWADQHRYLSQIAARALSQWDAIGASGAVWETLHEREIEWMTGRGTVKSTLASLRSLGWFADAAVERDGYARAIVALLANPLAMRGPYRFSRFTALRLLSHCHLHRGGSVAQLLQMTSGEDLETERFSCLAAAFYSDAASELRQLELELPPSAALAVFPWELQLLSAAAHYRRGETDLGDEALDIGMELACSFSATLENDSAREFAQRICSDAIQSWSGDRATRVQLRDAEIPFERLRASLFRRSRGGLRTRDRGCASASQIHAAVDTASTVFDFLVGITLTVSEALGAAAAFVVDARGNGVRVGVGEQSAQPQGTVSSLLLDRVHRQGAPIVIADALSSASLLSRRSVRSGGARALVLLPIDTRDGWYCCYFQFAGVGPARAAQLSGLANDCWRGALLGAELVDGRRRRVELEEQLRRRDDDRIREIELLNLGKAASSLAHELNNMLSVVIGEAQFLEQQFVDDLQVDCRDSVRNLVQAAADGGSLVRQALNSTRLERVARNDCVDLSMLVRDVGRQIRHRYPDVTVECHTPAAMWVLGCESELREVLVNVLHNASDAMLGAGVIRVYGAVDGEWTSVVVRDAGTGVPPELLDRVFEPFCSTKGASGNGLGLAIVRKIVSAHRGRVDLRNVSGGAEVEVVLPTASARGQNDGSKSFEPLSLTAK